MRCHAFDWTATCPDSTPLRTRPCPAPLPVVQISFTCVRRVDRSFGVGDARMTVVPSDLRYEPLLDFYTAHRRKTTKHRCATMIVNITRSRNACRYGLGYTDARLFEWNGSVFMLEHGFASSSDIRHGRIAKRMHIRAVLPHLLPPVQLRLPDIAASRAPEKNWCALGPANTAGTYLFARFAEPHQVLECRRDGACHVVATTSRAAFFTSLRRRHQLTSIHLGTNAVRVDSVHFGAILHGVVARPGQPRRYLNLPYLVQASHPFAITRVATHALRLPRPADNTTLKFHFTTGLTFVDGRLLVSYGYNDVRPMFLLTSVEALFSNLAEAL